jgi:hypothetical protein
MFRIRPPCPNRIPSARMQAAREFFKKNKQKIPRAFTYI